MRRWSVRFLLLLFILLVPRVADAADVKSEYVTEGESGDKYYIETTTLKIDGDMINFIMIRYYKEVRNGVRASISRVYYRPAERQYYVYSRSWMDQDAKELGRKIYDESWGPLRDGTVMAAMVKRAMAHLGIPMDSGQRPAKPQASQPKVATGSGFFITPSVVVTNHHVIDGANRIEVVFNNEVQLTATVIGADAGNDLALLRVVGAEDMIRPLSLGNSSEVREGSRIYAVGFPLATVTGTKAKITEGIVSSTTGFGGSLKEFQITAPVQPGNSGGPLLNERGEVIGVVSAVLGGAFTAKTGIIAQNVNFAIKASNIRNLIGNLSLDLYLEPSQQGGALSAPDIMERAKKAVVFIVAAQ